MKINIVKQEILKVLQLAQEASERDNINSYYSYFVFIAKDNKIQIKSANRQTTFEQSIEQNEQTKLNIFEEGGFLLPGNKILNIITALRDGLILLESNEMTLKITEASQNKSSIEFNVRMRDLTEFPKEIHSIEEKESCIISKVDLFRLINNTSFAVSSNLKESSMFLTGVFFDIQENELIAVATDRNRMSISKASVNNISLLKNSVEKDIIIPLKSIQFLKRILKTESSESIRIFANEEKIFFQIGNISLSANLISGKYYDYKRIIPEEKRNRITINTNDLRDAISRVSVATDNKKENNVLIIIENNILTIKAEEKEKSKAQETLNISKEGNDNSFLIKSQFLIDPLSIIEEENVYIDYGDNIKDLIKITSISDKNTLHIAAQLNQ